MQRTLARSFALATDTQPPEIDIAYSLRGPSLPACFGVACPRHGQCARYHAVGLSEVDAGTMVTCFDGSVFPRFVPLPQPQRTIGELTHIAAA